MTLDAHRRDTLLKTLRGTNFRRALKAVAELRTANDPTLAGIVGTYQPPDVQRGVQYKIAGIVLTHGVRGLVTEWPVLADEKWRAELIFEICQALDLWVDEATVDLVLTALEDESREVRVKAVWGLAAVFHEFSERDRRTARADSHRRAIAARDALRGWMTPARCSRATRGFVEMLAQHRHTPSVALPQIVETLGYTATHDDGDAVRALEALWNQSGEPFLVTHETLDESKLDWRERLLAERKGIAPERIKMRIGHLPTGLLDQKVLGAALQRIRARSGSERA